MTKATAKIRFKTSLLRPANPKGAAWSFLVLSANASAKLPTRSMTSVEGTLNGHPFQATLEPNGQRSHWLKVSRALRVAAGAEVGDTVVLEIAPMAEEPEPTLPADLRKALAANPVAKAKPGSECTFSRPTTVSRKAHAVARRVAGSRNTTRE